AERISTESENAAKPCCSIWIRYTPNARRLAAAFPASSVTNDLRNSFASQTNRTVLFTPEPEGSVIFRRSSPTLLCARIATGHTKLQTHSTATLRIIALL